MNVYSGSIYNPPPNPKTANNLKAIHWVNACYIHWPGRFRAIKSNTLLMRATAWKQISREFWLGKSHSPRVTCHMVLFMWHPLKDTTLVTENRSAAARVEGWGEGVWGDKETLPFCVHGQPQSVQVLKSIEPHAQNKGNFTVTANHISSQKLKGGGVFFHPIAFTK